MFRTEFERCPNDGGALAPWSGDPLLGSELAGRYVIEELVGQGSMGVIYRARHVCLPRWFAIKILFGDLIADPRMRTRFAQEAALASRLSHPNVVPVVDFGRTESGLLYLVMDYVEGEGLGDLMAREGPIEPVRAIRIARQLAQGLGHAHKRGLVHRDFKPGNVLLERQESGPPLPRVVDFGLAICTRQREEAPSRLTECGIIIGTPIYIAPEQVLDQSIDHRADLFALGVVMYEMLAGRPPFDGRPVEIAHKNVIQPVPPIAQRSPGVLVDLELERVVRRLLEKSPAERYGSADEVCAALDAALALVTENSAQDTRPGMGPMILPMRPAAAPAATDQALVADQERPETRPTGRRRKLAVAGALLFAVGVAIYALASHGQSARLPGLIPAPASAPRLERQPSESAPTPAQPTPVEPTPVEPAPASAPAAPMTPAAPMAPAATSPAATSPAASPSEAPGATRPAPVEPAAASPAATPSAAPTSRPAGVSRSPAARPAQTPPAPAAKQDAQPEPAATMPIDPLAGLRAAAGLEPAVAESSAAPEADDRSAGARPDSRSPSAGLHPDRPALPGPGEAATSPAAPSARVSSAPRAPIAVSPGRTRRESGTVPPIRFPRWEQAPSQITAKLCIDPLGAVTSVTVMSPVSQGVRATVQQALARWRYRPVVEGGAAVAACFATTFRVQVE